MENGEAPPSQLKGTLIKKDEPTETKLRGTLIEKRKAGESELPHDTLRELVGPDIKHAPTWKLDLNHGEVVRYGNLATQGFEATINNSSRITDLKTGLISFGQDAFAVSSDQRRFVVTDGMGGAADSLATGFMAKFIADQVAVNGADLLFDETMLPQLCQTARDLFRTKFGREIRTSPIKSSLIAGTATTTVSCIEINGMTVDGSYGARITVVGDSPVFILNLDGTIVRSFGEDIQRESTDSPLGFAVGIKRDGSPLIPKKGIVRNDAQVTDETISIQPGQRIVIGSDYFSETQHKESTGDFSFGRVREFIGLSPKDFSTKTKTIGKADDATLIVIDPVTLKTTE